MPVKSQLGVWGPSAPALPALGLPVSWAAFLELPCIRNATQVRRLGAPLRQTPDHGTQPQAGRGPARLWSFPLLPVWSSDQQHEPQLAWGSADWWTPSGRTQCDPGQSSGSDRSCPAENLLQGHHLAGLFFTLLPPRLCVCSSSACMRSCSADSLFPARPPPGSCGVPSLSWPSLKDSSHPCTSCLQEPVPPRTILLSTKQDNTAALGVSHF